MVITKDVKPNMRIIGADGVHVGTVDALEGERIKLKKDDSGSGSHAGHHHFIPMGIVAEVEDNQLRLSATAANAMLFREEADGRELHVEQAPARNAPSEQKSAFKTNLKTDKPDTNWGQVGLAVAALGALGAAVMATSKGRVADKPSRSSLDKKFHLRLQTDENMRLISSSKVENTPVLGRSGEHLGTIKSFMVDKYTGQVAYAVLTFGGTFGMGSSLFPIPWSMLDYDIGKDGYRLDVTKEQLATAPRFEQTNEPEFDPAYRKRVLVFHKIG